MFVNPLDAAFGRGAFMTTVHVLTGLKQPSLHIWRDRTAQSASELAYDAAPLGTQANGLMLFRALLDSQLHSDAHALVHEGAVWEQQVHRKTFPRTTDYRFPDELWCAEGASRVVAHDP